MPDFYVTVERKIVRRLLVTAATKAAARCQIDDYGLVEAFGDYAGGQDSESIHILAVKRAEK